MTILNTFTEIVGYAGGFSLGFWLIVIMCSVMAIITAVLAFKEKSPVSLVFAAIIVMFGVLFSMMEYDRNGEPIIETRYQVAFTDADTMNEALERYRVIEVEGRIFTITEKTADTN